MSHRLNTFISLLENYSKSKILLKESEDIFQPRKIKDRKEKEERNYKLKIQDLLSRAPKVEKRFVEEVKDFVSIEKPWDPNRLGLNYKVYFADKEYLFSYFPWTKGLYYSHRIEAIILSLSDWNLEEVDFMVKYFYEKYFKLQVTNCTLTKSEDERYSEYITESTDMFKPRKVEDRAAKAKYVIELKTKGILKNEKYYERFKQIASNLTIREFKVPSVCLKYYDLHQICFEYYPQSKLLCVSSTSRFYKVFKGIEVDYDIVKIILSIFFERFFGKKIDHSHYP